MLNATATTKARVMRRCKSSAISTYCVRLFIQPIGILQIINWVAIAPSGRYCAPPSSPASQYAINVKMTAIGSATLTSSLIASM